MRRWTGLVVALALVMAAGSGANAQGPSGTDKMGKDTMMDKKDDKMMDKDKMGHDKMMNKKDSKMMGKDKMGKDTMMNKKDDKMMDKDKMTDKK